MKTGDPKVDSFLAQIEAGRIRVSDRVRNEIEDLAGGVGAIPASHPGLRQDRAETLDRLRAVIGEVTRRHNEIADPFLEDPRNEKYPFEDGQGNVGVREVDARGHSRETITMTRDEVAAKRAQGHQVNEELVAIRDIHKDADSFAKAAGDTSGPQGAVLREKADELRAEARQRKNALRDAADKRPDGRPVDRRLWPTADEIARTREAKTAEVANILALSRSGQFGEAIDAAHGLDRERLHELFAAADDRERTLIDFLKAESTDDMTQRAMAGGQIIREGMRGEVS